MLVQPIFLSFLPNHGVTGFLVDFLTRLALGAARGAVVANHHIAVAERALGLFDVAPVRYDLMVDRVFHDLPPLLEIVNEYPPQADCYCS